MIILQGVKVKPDVNAGLEHFDGQLPARTAQTVDYQGYGRNRTAEILSRLCFRPIFALHKLFKVAKSLSHDATNIALIFAFVKFCDHLFLFFYILLLAIERPLSCDLECY